MQQDRPVIIVGGGPVGLGAALELARFGVRSVLIEKHASTSLHPKTRNFNTRTMEIAMGWGEVVYNRLRAIDTPPGWKTPIRFLESATGKEFGSIDSQGFEGPGPEVSPAEPIMSSQDLIEEIMLDAIRTTGLVDVRFSTRALGLIVGGDDGDAEIALEVEDIATGAVETLTGVALVAADGAESPIRAQLGLEMEGFKDVRRLVNCYFRANIEAHIGDRKGVLLFVNNPGATGVLQPLDANGRWLSQINVDAEDWSLEAFSKERARDWVRAAAGVDDLDVEVLSLGLWKLNATTVEQFVKGRVILCGDAAHQFPPTGGLGVNTGLQGMHNAMWKLAAFVKGWAGWGLVKTYHDERRPVSQAIVGQSFMNSANVARINASAASGSDSGLSTGEIVIASRRYGNHLGVEFGACYGSPAIIPDGTTPPEVADTYSDYTPCATPGCRAPHVWMGSGATRRSTLDLIGLGFTILAGSQGSAWSNAAAEASSSLGVPIDSHLTGPEDDDAFRSAYGLSGAGGVLIRPDGHVAARWPDAIATGAEKAGAIRAIVSPQS